MVNFIKLQPLNSRLFQLLCKEMDAEHKSLLLHTEVCCLSRGKVSCRIYKLRQEVVKFISDNKSKINPCVDNEIWRIKLDHLTDIFSHLNKLNTRMQGRNKTVLTTTDKLYGFLLKLKLWQTNVIQGVFKMFPLTEVAAKAVNRGILKKSIGDHLEMLQQRFESYFQNLEIFKYHWVRNPFNQSASSNACKLKLKTKEQPTKICMDRTLQLKHKEKN